MFISKMRNTLTRIEYNTVARMPKKMESCAWCPDEAMDC